MRMWEEDDELEQDDDPEDDGYRSPLRRLVEVLTGDSSLDDELEELEELEDDELEDDVDGTGDVEGDDGDEFEIRGSSSTASPPPR